MSDASGVRGEIWTVERGIASSTPWPAVIVQDEAFDGTASVTVLPLTSNLIDAPFLRVRVPRTRRSGLERESDVMIDKPTTVRRENMAARVGRLSAAQLAEVERAMMVFLGLAR
ncbi:type II toxin-antitoxin system PemK/MazF family toxin [Microbacterium sp. A84]|uniref:type II toxin-antitoxin system PemK/MazF family toxin n=1 Tax=Microbacterium sp. A84 TaxID=3450715 RepID=UPI003F43FD46